MPVGSLLSPIDPPRGIHIAHVDEQGRLQVPGRLREYLAALGETTVFVTSFDRQTARIYPMAVWVDEVQPLMYQPGPHSRIARQLWFTANWLGCDCRMDRSGRLTLGKELRETLHLDSRLVHLYHERGHFAVLPESSYLERCKGSLADAGQNLLEMEELGLR
jgi:DNA-binding transcriptional regulator/RsmH inhibitor MraZ